MFTVEDRRGYALQDQVSHHCVIDAVGANFKHGRPFSQHWDLYMNTEQRRQFSNNLACFIQACQDRRRWLTL